MRQASYEDIHKLVNEMRAGSIDARQKLIEAHVPLAFSLANQFEDDEALSAALMTLVEEVDKFRVGEQHAAALPAYLKTALSRVVIQHKRKYAKNSDNDLKHYMKSGHQLPEFVEFNLLDIMDRILGCCESQLEEKIIFYKAQGLNNCKVGALVGTSSNTVAILIRNLEHRYIVQERLHAQA